MSFDQLRRRLDMIERRTRPAGLGRLPAVRIITRSQEDCDRQIAALIAAGEYSPDQLLIDRRIVSPDPMIAHPSAHEPITLDRLQVRPRPSPEGVYDDVCKFAGNRL